MTVDGHGQRNEEHEQLACHDPCSARPRCRDRRGTWGGGERVAHARPRCRRRARGAVEPAPDDQLARLSALLRGCRAISPLQQRCPVSAPDGSHRLRDAARPRRLRKVRWAANHDRVDQAEGERPSASLGQPCCQRLSRRPGRQRLPDAVRSPLDHERRSRSRSRSVDRPVPLQEAARAIRPDRVRPARGGLQHRVQLPKVARASAMSRPPVRSPKSRPEATSRRR